LVPIVPVIVRVCKYSKPRESASLSGLVASGLLRPPVSASFAEETNNLPRSLGPPACPGVPSGRIPVFYLTFANASQRVAVEGSPWCGGEPSNGRFTAEATPRWFNELTRHVSTRSKGP